MTNELLKAWLECLKRDLRCECCVNDECEHCDLLKKQGTLKERIDALDKVIKALEEEPCKDWKFYYNHGYAQAKKDLLCDNEIFEEWLSSFNTDSAPICFNKIQELKRECEKE